jgi:YbbR domain-containing protein
MKPSSVTVTVEERITKEFKVEAEINASQIEDGYSAGQPVVGPNKVKITGAKSMIDRISYVKATLEEKGKLKETITRDARIQVLDKDLNKLNVVVDPDTVKVTVPVKSNTKTVPISVVKKGSAPSGVTIVSIELDENEATITGTEEVLKETENVRVEVDISKISENTTLSLPVIISNGITKVTPQMVKATVVVKKEEDKTVSSIPISIRGLTAAYKAEINDPASRTINVEVNGPSGAVVGLKPEDFSAYIDVTGLTEGSHDVPIQVDGPTGVNWQPDKETAKVSITKNA